MDVPLPDNSPTDRAAEFVRLLAAYERRLTGYVVALMPNWNDAEDIIQQTKLRLWEQFQTYDPSKDFGTWACVIARYEVQTFRKRAIRSRVHFSQEFIDRVSGQLTRSMEKADERISLLEQCLRKLSEWQRDLLWRCCVAGDSTIQVASQLGRKNEATRKALLRVRRKLYRCIEAAQRREAKPS